MPPSRFTTLAVHRRILTKPIILRHLHSSPQPPPQPSTEINHPLTHPIYTVWAANTCLGKTLVSAGLSMSFLLPPSSTSVRSRKFVYLKPVQTGLPTDSDSRFVYRKFSEYFLHYRPHLSVYASNCILRASVPAYKAMLGNNGKFGCGLENSVLGNGLVGENENNGKFGGGMENLGWYEERKLQGGENGNAEMGELSELICKTMYGWKEAVSPHLAAERERGMVVDSELLEMLRRCLWVGSETGSKMDRKEEKVDVMCVVETAGGVASPGPSGVLQCDLYRPFRLPAILVGDGKLGGISGTISAYESLKLRGYDVVAVIFEDHGLVNQAPLSSYLGRRIPVLVLPPIPQDMSDNLVEWFDKSKDVFSSLKEIMVTAFHERMHRLHELPKKAHKIFWWPFTQHNLVPPENVTVIDSRCGENFSVHQVTGTDSIAQQFDACASWWTQGPDSVLQIELARALGYAAARYGHIMFPENVYEPALGCAELLLEGVGKGWASRTYFSDNGSTAIEIALKMAFRKFLFDHEILLDLPNNTETYIDLKVLALRGSYHGDTLGAMEAQAPSPYTGIYQQPWYKGRGIFLDPPTVSMSGGVWELCLPKKIDVGCLEMEHFSFNSRDEIFEKRRDATGLADIYSSYILQNLSLIDNCRGSVHIGALIIEPVVQGAGGMELIDPLFQRILVKECQVRKIPVIFDEVFTGFWRLGAESAAELLCCQPDISCFAKLMTGGVLPLAATLASEATFEAFLGESKLKALLHGHSYTAHAMGCAAAVKSIKWFKNSKTNHNLISGMRLRELWDAEVVDRMSFHPAVQRVVALGTICAIELRAEGCNTGYASLYATSLVQKLREDGIYTRPLGNVIYLMCGPLTSPHVCRGILEKVYMRLEEFSQRKSEACELI